jgi:hypothetical protein
MRNAERAAVELKKIIDCSGPRILSEKPYMVYQEMMQSDDVDRKTASMILYLLINNIHSQIDSGSTPDFISEKIRKKCCLNESAADYMSEIMCSLYTKENEESWKEKEREGLKKFLEEDFACEWNGYSVWDAGNGTVSCYYQAKIILKPANKAAANKDVLQMLNENPFTSKETIHDYFEKELCSYLDSIFEEYCKCDDYYQPEVEDFDIEGYVSEWTDKCGFGVLVCEGEGDDGGYEPKFRNNWY